MVKKSKQWYQDHINDPFVKEAKSKGYRSRATFKLSELDERAGLFKPGMSVVDLGAAPGGWSEYALQKVGEKGKVIGIDLLPMDPIQGVTLLQGDFTDESMVNELLALLSDQKADVVMSDMAPNISGVAVSDQLRMSDLARRALHFATQALRPEGKFVIKLFHGQGFDQVVSEAKKAFKSVSIRKPKASKAKSKEVYLFAHTFRDILPAG